MNAIKKHLKLLIGIAAVLMILVGVAAIMRSGNLESGSMRQWMTASADRRAAAVKILTGTEEHSELMVACLDKIASLPDSSDMPVKDATTLCFMGIQLRENI
jgi:uncharacterized membrane protein